MKSFFSRGKFDGSFLTVRVTYDGCGGDSDTMEIRIEQSQADHAQHLCIVGAIEQSEFLLAMRRLALQRDEEER